MRLLPGTGIRLPSPPNPPPLAETTVVVCGENSDDVFSAADSTLKGWSHETLCWRFREFYCRRYRSSNGASVNVFVGGLGSASVELILQEGTLAGSRQFILTGSCASLNAGISVGGITVPERFHLRPGAFSEYRGTQASFTTHSNLQSQLREYLDKRSMAFHSTSIISTDAFYALGGTRDTEGAAIYAGAPMASGEPPQSLYLALENPWLADTLDMECAPFFALGELLAGVEVAALKVVSNAIPWDDSFDEAAINSSIQSAVTLSLQFAIEELGPQKK